MTANVQVPSMKTNRTRRLVTTFGFATFGLLAALALSTPANADGVPPLFPVQGVLTGSDGTAVDGPHDIVLRLHGQAEGGTALYQETHADLVVESGSFLAYLGGGTPSAAALTAEVFEDNQDLWLEVAVDGEVITPRFKYGSVPFAAVAGESGNALQLGGNPPGHYRYASGAGITLSSPGNVLSVADRGITTEKLATGIAVSASTLSTTGAATLASGTVSGALNVSGATTLASGTVSGTLRVNGATTLAGTTASTLTTTGAATLASANVSGALDVNGATTLGSATATLLTSTGNLDVDGVAFVGLRQFICVDATTCTCQGANMAAIGGGVEGTPSRIPYLAHPIFGTAFKAECTGSAAPLCPEVHVLCARLGN